MHESLIAGSVLIASYLLGAVPFTLIAGRFKGIDIRKHGSGNLGATNAIRVHGKPIGLTVFVLDFLKGLGPVLLAGLIKESWIPDIDLKLLAFCCGLSAVLGHIFPIYLNFKGGKGVAAASGALLAVKWDAALVSFAVFFLVRKITRYVSASSIALGLTFPAALLIFDYDLAVSEYRWVTVGAAALSLLIVIRHKSNIVRIIKGEESKIGKKKTKED